MAPEATALSPELRGLLGVPSVAMKGARLSGRIGQYRRDVRWTTVIGVLLLAGCQQLEPTQHPTALPGPVAEGKPDAPISVAGQQWDRCTRKQMRQYPPVLDEPAATYYAGPWCQDADGGTRFMWIYAQPLFTGETGEEVRGYVNEDANLLVRGLRTTGYLPVRSGPRGQDVVYEARRPTSPNLVSIQVLGDDPPPPGQSFTGDNPLRLIVAVRKATADDMPSPSGSPSP